MKHIIFTISLLALVSCKDGKTDENSSKINVNVESSEALHNSHDDESENIYTNAWTSDINLNDGAKWQANVETNEGVKKMQDVLKTIQTTSLEDYHELANQLNESKNYVIKNCTMKGPSHDYLHVWLLPLMAKIEALSETKTVEDASEIKNNIEENINRYNTYFH
ncbi:hypothetical protein [Algibacter sp.]|uniref:hypothetical protein n=1 Tax=Algibacter sp. TaxID=1872428 RepID=UPI003C719881